MNHPPSRRWLSLILIALLGLAASAGAGSREESRVRAARWIYEELLLGDQSVVPAALLRQSKCIAIFPNVTEAAFGLGGSYGHGVASCRDGAGGWSPPSFLKIGGGSIGLQLGFRRVDLLLFFVSDRGSRALARSQFSFGGEASVAAGPVDRRAEVSTDPLYDKDIYLYARASGLFAGAALEGSRLSVANKAIERYYGVDYRPEKILFDAGVGERPPEAREFIAGLARLPAD